MAAVQPIAGAMYHWTYALTPSRYRNFAAWMQGYITWAGWLSMTIGIGNSSASWVTSLVQLNYPGYAPALWHSTLLIWAMLAFTKVFNLYKFGKLVPWVECFAGLLHIFMSFAFTITLLVLAPKGGARFVFLGRVDSAQTSGWRNDFVSWNLGLQTSVWTFVGFDAAVHLSEEVQHARKIVPRVMFHTIVFNGLMAWLFILTILFTVGDVTDALQFPQPMLAVLLNATGTVGAATAMGSLLVFIGICAMVVNVAAMSRLTWSWARDGGLPKFFALVDDNAHVPARAVLGSILIVALLCLVNVGSSVALSIFISLSTIALYVSYFISISVMVTKRWSSRGPEGGAWSMGRFGLPVNIFALVYTAWVLIWLPFPTTLPVTNLNFNYAGPIFVGVVVVAWSLWLFRRDSWKGLREDIVDLAIKEEIE